MMCNAGNQKRYLLFDIEQSGMLRVRLRTNEERHAITLVGKCCSD